MWQNTLRVSETRLLLLQLGKFGHAATHQVAGRVGRLAGQRARAAHLHAKQARAAPRINDPRAKRVHVIRMAAASRHAGAVGANAGGRGGGCTCCCGATGWARGCCCDGSHLVGHRHRIQRPIFQSRNRIEVGWTQDKRRIEVVNWLLSNFSVGHSYFYPV